MKYLLTSQSSIFNLPEVLLCTKEAVISFLIGNKYIGLDTETTGFYPQKGDKLLCVQFGNRDNQYIIDTNTVDISFLSPFLRDQSKVYILQNAKFDIRFFYQLGMYFNMNIYDTYLAECIIYNNGDKMHRKDLNSLGIRYLNIPIPKDDRGLIHKKGLYDTKVLNYCAKDVEHLEDIMNAQMVLLKQHDLLRVMQIENYFVEVLAYVEWSGFKLDVPKWKEKILRVKAELEDKLVQLNQWIIDNNIKEYIDYTLFGVSTVINWNSPKQITALFKKLNIPVETVDKKTGQLKLSTSAKNIKKVEKEFPLVELYLSYKKVQKDLSTYGESFLKQLHIDHRIYTSFNQIMDTGRTSCGGKDKNSKVEKINLQNIPRDKFTRSCFISDKGNSLICCDYTGQEQVIMANVCQDKNMLNFYAQGLDDAHSYVVSLSMPELIIPGIPLKDNLKHIKDNYPEIRQRMKSAGFALNYCGNGYTVAENLNISVEEGNKLEKQYFEAYPGLKDYFSRQEKFVLDKGYILINDVSGRKFWPKSDHFEWKLLNDTFDREFWDNYSASKKHDGEFYNSHKKEVKRWAKLKSNMKKNASNGPIQGTGADVSKTAGIYFLNKLKEEGMMFKVRIPNFVHDEWDTEAPDNIANTVAIWLKEAMERAATKFCRLVPIKAVPKITKEWEH